VYNLYIRDAHLNRIGEITDYTRLDLIPRFNNVGSFVLELPTNTQAAKELIKRKAGIIVKKDGQTVFSGTVTGRGRSFSSNGDSMTLTGKDDNNYLARTLAYPETNGSFSSQAYDVRTGKAEAVMKQYMDYNMGPNAELSRRLLQIESDKGLGSTVTGRARFHVLLELLRSLALSGGGLGFRVLQVDNQLQFQVYEPSDKTRSAFFSPLLGNLASFEYSNEDPEANLVIVGAGGEGSDRIIKWKADNSSIVKHGRTEIFVDRRDTTDIAELEQKLDEELINHAEQNSFNFVPVDTPQLSFGKHYNLGDKVSVVLTQPNEVVDEETLYYFISAYQTVQERSERVRKIQDKLEVIQDIVREVKISITPNGDIISPVVGTEESNQSSILGIFDKQKKLERRINKLERR
jgi:hypothetical protein